MRDPAFEPGQVLVGPFFNEPMRVETVRPNGTSAWVVGLVGIQSGCFRRVTLTNNDVRRRLAVQLLEKDYRGDGSLVRLGLQAYSLGIAYEFDPYLGLSSSRVDPLPHQLEAVYDHLLKAGRVRFLLADDAGAGKTIVAGLLIRELKLRGLIERILVVCPANLTFHWQRELEEKFDEKFVLLTGQDIRDQFSVNQWLRQKQVLTSLDLATRTEILPGLHQVHWDLVVVDEAHRMSRTSPSRKTGRYAVGELLRETSDHLLLLTATPHKGDPTEFAALLQLLDRDAYADARSIQQALEQRRAPFYLRRTKEAMVCFPERQADGTWVARKIFTKRISQTVGFVIGGAECELYADVSRFVKQQSALAAAQGEDPRARAVGFLMALYQRRLASSTYALRQSLEKRAKRLEQGSQRVQELAPQAPPNLPAPEELEEMEDGERERLEEMLEAVTLESTPESVHREATELERLAAQARAVEDSEAEGKLAQLKDVLHEEGFFDHPNQRLLLFTEFKDTLDYLVGHLRRWGFRVGFIHAGMKPGSRDEIGTRLHAEHQFQGGATQVLVATEAAAEGMNLECCHILVNYDVPWNPNRLEERVARIHRYGQHFDCLIFNFVATNTIEGRVLQRLLKKLYEIRDALDDDAVFNLAGEILPPARIDRVLLDYYAGQLGDADLEERLLRDVEESRFRAICQNALERLASKSLNLARLLERRAHAQERRVVPETIARFMGAAAVHAGLVLRPVTQLPHTFDPERTPTALRKCESAPEWKLPGLSGMYPRLSTDREVAEKNSLEWVTPGHPLFEALRCHTLDVARSHFGKGACFYSLSRTVPSRADFYRARVVDGLGHVAHERLFAVELAEGMDPVSRGLGFLEDLTLTSTVPSPLPDVATRPESTAWLHERGLAPFLEEARQERLAEVKRIGQLVELSLAELLERADEEIGKAAAEVERNVAGAEGRLAQAELRHAELVNRRDQRRTDLERQRAMTLQEVERIASILILPHPERDAPEVRELHPDNQTDEIAMRVANEYEEAHGRQAFDVHEEELGYDLTSLDRASGELRLIAVKGIGKATGAVALTPNERLLAGDRRDCYWLYVVTRCATSPQLEDPIKDPARLPWHQAKKVDHYWLPLAAMTRPDRQ